MCFPNRMAGLVQIINPQILKFEYLNFILPYSLFFYDCILHFPLMLPDQILAHLFNLVRLALLVTHTQLSIKENKQPDHLQRMLKLEMATEQFMMLNCVALMAKDVFLLKYQSLGIWSLTQVK